MFIVIAPFLLLLLSSIFQLIRPQQRDHNQPISSDIDNQGKFKATMLCWILGFGSLVAWNSMLTIGDYYYDLFPVKRKRENIVVSLSLLNE